MQKDCIFCKIVHHDAPAYIVYEDEMVMAILDTDPITDGHTLVLPKKDILDIHSLDPETGGHILKVAQMVADALKETFHFEGITLMQSNGAFQDVPHFHLHVFGRSRERDITVQYPVGTKKEKDDLAQNEGKIKDFLMMRNNV